MPNRQIDGRPEKSAQPDQKKYSPFVSDFAVQLTRTLLNKKPLDESRFNEIGTTIASGNPFRLIEALAVCYAVVFPNFESLVNQFAQEYSLDKEGDRTEKIKKQIGEAAIGANADHRLENAYTVLAYIAILFNADNIDNYRNALGNHVMEPQEYSAALQWSGYLEAAQDGVIERCLMLARAKNNSERYNIIITKINPYQKIVPSQSEEESEDYITLHLYKMLLAKARYDLDKKSTDIDRHYQTYLCAESAQARSKESIALLRAVSDSLVLQKCIYSREIPLFTQKLLEVFTLLTKQDYADVLQFFTLEGLPEELTPEQKNLLCIVFFEPVSEMSDNINSSTLSLMRKLREWQQWFILQSTVNPIQDTQIQELRSAAAQLGQREMIMYAGRLLVREAENFFFGNNLLPNSPTPEFIRQNQWVILAKSLRKWGASEEMIQTVQLYAIKDIYGSRISTLTNRFISEDSNSTDFLILNDQLLVHATSHIQEAQEHFTIDPNTALMEVSNFDPNMLENAQYVSTILDAEAKRIVEHITDPNHWHKLPIINNQVSTFVVEMPTISDGLSTLTFHFMGEDIHNWCAFVEISAASTGKTIPAIITSDGEISLLIPDSFLPQGLASVFKHSIGYVLELLLTKVDKIDAVPHKKNTIDSKPESSQDPTVTSDRRRPRVIGLPVVRYRINPTGLHREIRQHVSYIVPIHNRGRKHVEGFRQNRDAILALRRELEKIPITSPIRSEMQQQLEELMKIHINHVTIFSQPTPLSLEGEIDELTGTNVFLRYTTRQSYYVAGTKDERQLPPRIQQAKLRGSAAEALIEMWQFIQSAQYPTLDTSQED